MGQDQGDVFHSLVVVGAVGLDELLDQGPLDLSVLLLDAPSRVRELSRRQLLRDQLQLLDDIRGLV